MVHLCLGYIETVVLISYKWSSELSNRLSDSSSQIFVMSPRLICRKDRLHWRTWLCWPNIHSRVEQNKKTTGTPHKRSDKWSIHPSFMRDAETCHFSFFNRMLDSKKITKSKPHNRKGFSHSYGWISSGDFWYRWRNYTFLQIVSVIVS